MSICRRFLPLSQSPHIPRSLSPTMSQLRRFLVNEDGPTAVEYAVMLALILLAALVGIASVGTATSDLFNTSSSEMQAHGIN